MKRYLLAPGPTPIPPEVLQAMAQPIIHHRAPEYEAIFADVRRDLRLLFQCKNEVLMLAASGTGAMEGAVVNTLSPGDPVVVVRGGKFGERWAEIHLEYRGEIASLDCIPLTVATVKGILDPIHDSVNTVNAMAIARGRGVRVIESKSTEPTDFASLITITLQTDRGKTETAGTLFSRQDPRVVEIDGFRLEAVLDGYMLIFSNLDVPGVIGRIGTLLGQNNVNIAGMQLGREKRGGRAVSIVNVDDPIPGPVLDEIRQMPNVVYAKLVRA